MELANRFKGKYCMRFKKKNGIQAECKISIVPIRLPCRPGEDLNLVVCRGIGQEPMLLVTNLKSDDNRISVMVTKVYLLRWRIEEFYAFKKQQFDFEDFRVRSLNAIRNLDMLLTIAIGYIGIMSEHYDERRNVMEVIKISKRIYGVQNSNSSQSQMVYTPFLQDAFKVLPICYEKKQNLCNCRYFLNMASLV